VDSCFACCWQPCRGLVGHRPGAIDVARLPLQSQRAEVRSASDYRYHDQLSPSLVNERKVWGGLVPMARCGGGSESEYDDYVQRSGHDRRQGARQGDVRAAHDSERRRVDDHFFEELDVVGAFTYDEKEDALRVTVKPKAADMHNALTYDFDELKPDSAVVELEWEKVAVPFKVSVDVHDLVEASLKKQLRNLSQYTWQSWDDAANYLLAEKVDLDGALIYANKSIENEDRFDNEDTKAKVLTALNRKDDAAMAQKKALELASAQQMHGYGRQLMGEKRNEEAFAIFRENAKKHPEVWIVHGGWRGCTPRREV